ncbi:DsbA family oxidoreductase [Psychrosphaera aestuarii]
MMSNKIKLDIISDVVCPWCVIGYKHLNAAITELGIQDKVEIEWQPFELNPDMPPEGEELTAHIMRKYGSSKEDSDKARDNLKQLGAEYGFEFNYFEGMKIVNTFNAHVLLDLAHQLGKQTELKLRLFSACFTEQKDVSDVDVLLNEAEAVGIDRDKASAALADKTIHQRVRELEGQWRQMGVSGVPTVVFNRKTGLTGAQPQETFKQVLLEIMAESQLA